MPLSAGEEKGTKIASFCLRNVPRTASMRICPFARRDYEMKPNRFCSIKRAGACNHAAFSVSWTNWLSKPIYQKGSSLHTFCVTTLLQDCLNVVPIWSPFSVCSVIQASPPRASISTSPTKPCAKSTIAHNPCVKRWTRNKHRRPRNLSNKPVERIRSESMFHEFERFRFLIESGPAHSRCGVTS